MSTQVATQVGGGSGSAWARFALSAAVFVVAFAVFVPSLRSDFTNWDDGVYTHADPLLVGRTRQERLSVLWPPWEPYYSEYAPLTHLSLLLDRAVSGEGFNPIAFHLSSVVIHALNAALVCLLLRGLGGGALMSAAGALIFAVHPAQVESVSWVSQRKTIVAMLFFLLAFLAYLRWRRTGALWSYAAGLAAFLAALLSKQSTVVLPALLLLYELLLCEGPGPRSRRWLATLPFFLLTFFGIAIGWWGQAKTGALGTWPGGGGVIPFVATMLPVLWRYVLLMILPGFPMHPNAMHTPPEFLTLLAAEPLAALAATLAAVAVLALWRNRWSLFWAGWFLVGLAPYSEIIPLKILLGERYLYIPAVAVGAAGGHLAQYVWNWLRARGARRAARYSAGLGSVAVAAMLVLITVNREAVWRDSGTLWRDTIPRSPIAATPRADLGEWYLQRMLNGKAEQQFRIVLDISPFHAGALVNLAKLVAERGDLAQAERMYNAALVNPEQESTLATAHLGLALVAERLYHDPRRELDHFELSLRYDPYQDQAAKIAARIEQLRELLRLPSGDPRRPPR